MDKKKLKGRPLMTGPVMLRRGAVVGEVRIYQELIKLAAEKNRITQESLMWSRKGQGIEEKLQAIERYQKDLFARLSLSRSVSTCPERKNKDDAAEQKEHQGGSSNGAMKLKF